MNLLITLCARGGSKGVKRKNIKPLNGKPLIHYSIDTAKEFTKLFPGDIALLTDDSEIKKCAADAGVTTDYMRPAELATDNAGKVAVIEDLLQYEEKRTGKQYDYILDLDISAPLRTVDDLINAFKLVEDDPESLNLFSVSPPHRNPYFNMVELADDGYYKLIRKTDNVVLTRQSAPKVYDLNASFYIYKRSFFTKGHKSVLTDRALAYEVPHVCFDIDTPLDFEIMEFLVSGNKLGFTL